MSGTHDTRHETADPSGIAISHHARLRAMMRLGVVEGAANYLRELLDKAERVDVDHVENAHAWRVGDVTIVTDTRDEVVQTVFEREEEGRGR